MFSRLLCGEDRAEFFATLKQVRNVRRHNGAIPLRDERIAALKSRLPI
ncbi:hypothetical protein GBP346_B1815 [Burkholderia pseudomallei MSHR346]|nr:hypothetical protein GBP346_B1815 [Burkholderia pseudomallei MSHR346]